MRKLQTLLLAGAFCCPLSLFAQIPQKIQPTGLAQLDFFGVAAALNADASWFVVGAPGHDVPGNGNNVNNEGAFYVFNRPQGDNNFTLNNTPYVNPELVDGAAMGSSVAINAAGNFLATGAPMDGGPSPSSFGQKRGSVHVYARSGSAWNRLPTETGASVINLPSSQTGQGANFGASVSLSRLAAWPDGPAYVAAGAPGVDGNNANVTQGKAFVVYYDGATWVSAEIPNPSPNALDYFGAALALNADGSVLVAGAPGDNGAMGNTDLGAAYVFTRSGNNTWTSVATLPPPPAVVDFAFFGTSVDINDAGNVVVVGCPGCAYNSAHPGGAFVYRYDAMTDAWQMDPGVFGAADGDQFGTSVSINAGGDFLLAGSPGAGTNGAITSFKYLAGTWVQDRHWTREDADNSAAGVDENFGAVVSLGRSSLWGATGAPNQDGTPGTDIGAAYVFRPSALPVTWLSFRAKLEGNDKALLSWSTASESNNEGFNIQRSENGRDWQTIAFVQGAGTTSEISNYSHTDYTLSTLHSPLIYYRLQQKDFDGATDYSPVRVVVLPGSDNGGVKLYPNPASEFVILSFGEPAPVRGRLQVLTPQGRLIAEHVIPAQAAQFELRVAGLAPGMYMLRVAVGAKVWTGRVVVE